LPQWNCNCSNCARARQGKIPPLTQSSVAICADPGQWFLLNASPDLPAQILACPELQPDKKSPRNSPITGVLLTNADLDHTLGVVSLREGGGLDVFATKAVRECADIAPGITGILEAFGGVAWHEPPLKKFETLPGAAGSQSSLEYRSIALPGKPPKFATGKSKDGVHSVAYEIGDRRTKGRLLVAPDVAELTAELREAMAAADAVFFDGTFWSADELAHVKAKAASASEMGHVTIKDGSLGALRGLTKTRRVYIHINNTNPILMPGSPERAEVAAAGIEIGYDGLSFEL
jgi:pyrroloquinoline quinone biosynthesis protein B